MNNLSNTDLWYLRARYKFVWDKETLDPYVQVIAEGVRYIITKYDNNPKYVKQFASPTIGFFRTMDDEEETKIVGYALYISDARLPHDRRRTVFSEFKSIYEIHMGRGLARNLLSSDSLIRELSPDNAEMIIQRKNERSKLIGDFVALTHKSLNHSRTIGPRLRYKILKRDNFTCQNCGRKAPEVRLHVDHIEPVSWGTNFNMSTDPDDYQTLCEDCNLGKGDMSWLFDA